jgi:glycosyltransferase involved in cell wall biosynthesis
MKLDDVGVVVIGRNEGQRLVECLTSVRALTKNIIYVDSGSTDNSIAVNVIDWGKQALVPTLVLPRNFG